MIHNPLLPLFGVLCISWGCNNISIGPWCCDGLPCWVIVTERLWRWGQHTDDFGYSLLICLIKWIPVYFIELGQAIRAVFPLYLSHSSMRYVVSGRLDSLLIPTLSVVCLCSLVREDVITGPKCIPWLWLIDPWSVGKLKDLTRNPYVRWLRLGCPLSSKIPKGLPRHLWHFFCSMIYPWYAMWCNI